MQYGFYDCVGMEFFREKGLSEYAVVGILKNIYAETGGDDK